jgi:Anti-sigma factor NepR
LGIDLPGVDHNKWLPTLRHKLSSLPGNLMPAATLFVFVPSRRKVYRTPWMEVEVASNKLDSNAKAKIGLQLRAMYSDVVNQGVPARFAEILRRLDEKPFGGALVPKEASSGNNGLSEEDDSEPHERSNGPAR